MVQSLSLAVVQLIRYPTPAAITYFWSFGSLAGITMAWQTVTGLGLMASYDTSAAEAAEAIERMMRDSDGAWLTRFTHASMASAAFLWIYCHQYRGVAIGSRGAATWLSGWLAMVLLILAAFLGYVLAWGNMSFWAATVITSLVTVIPAGLDILGGLWGGPIIM